MMPMVILRCGNDVLQKSKIDSRIRMNQHGMDGHKQNINIKYQRRKPKYIQGRKRRTSGHKNIDEMRPASCQPIHVVRGMVYGMKSPEIRIRMEKTMRPILTEICDKKCHQQLHNKRQILHPFLQATEIHLSKRFGDGSSDQNTKKLNEQMTDREIHQIGFPFFVESRLIRTLWPHHFDRHKNDGHK